MKQVSLILGIITIIGMFIGFIPCLGWFNWLNIPLAVTGIIIGVLAYNEERRFKYDSATDRMVNSNSSLPLGLILCSIALVLGFIRLVIGFGIL
ncbi:MAG: hypothetical protein EOO45_32265 [Flavobacterium sp.]|nr:MAG: hypothetical protein EOO45_32265 [Flavobacterium sp.]